jgi:hypothetical protein
VSDIQRARDVLAKLRVDATARGRWREQDHEVMEDSGGLPWVESRWVADVDSVTGNGRLIVGTAGNPELLDAIDALLAAEQRRRASMHDNLSHDLSHHAERIAAAIIAADERMNA